MSSTNVKIRKAKIKDDLFLEVEYTEELPGHSKKDTKMSSTVPVHDDLKAAFQKLHKHMAILTSQVEVPKNLKALESIDFEGFEVKGFSIGGNDENTGVSLSGSLEGDYGTVNLTSPFQKYEQSEYKFMSDCAGDVERCIYEVEQYLFEGKRAPEKQLDLGFGEEEEKDLAEQE